MRLKLTVLHRITPAHAGTSVAISSCVFPLWDHPRTRGDKSVRFQLEIMLQGSPPHTRGQDMVNFDVRSLPRITPAHAGTSKDKRKYELLIKDHPRTRGDKQDCFAGGFFLAGSPPHTRGQAKGLPYPERKGRITPAHAGTREWLL